MSSFTSSYRKKPSKRYVKYGFLERDEEFNPLIHNTVEKWLDPIRAARARNVNYRECPNYYNEEEFDEMLGQFKNAVCPVCNKEITEKTNCKVCENGHKFHAICPDYREIQQVELRECPSCRNKELSDCVDHLNTFSGGKHYKRSMNRRKRTNKKRILNKKRRTNKRR